VAGRDRVLLLRCGEGTLEQEELEQAGRGTGAVVGTALLPGADGLRLVVAREGGLEVHKVGRDSTAALASLPPGAGGPLRGLAVDTAAGRLFLLQGDSGLRTLLLGDLLEGGAAMEHIDCKLSDCRSLYNSAGLQQLLLECEAGLLALSLGPAGAVVRVCGPGGGHSEGAGEWREGPAGPSFLAAGRLHTVTAALGLVAAGSKGTEELASHAAMARGGLVTLARDGGLQAAGAAAGGAIRGLWSLGFLCPVCLEVKRIRHKYTKHMAIHRPRNFRCLGCRGDFADRAALLAHRPCRAICPREDCGRVNTASHRRIHELNSP
jgi:hypothetical protein